MRIANITASMCSIFWLVTAVAQGDNAGPGSIDWPPPGGSSAVVNTSPPNFPGNAPSLYQPYLAPNGYRKSAVPQLIPAPGKNWPRAEYAMPVEAPQPSGSVEVVPPPSIPVEAVDVDLSRHPQRDWRPMNRRKSLLDEQQPLTTQPAEPTFRKDTRRHPMMESGKD